MFHGECRRLYVLQWAGSQNRYRAASRKVLSKAAILVQGLTPTYPKNGKPHKKPPRISDIVERNMTLLGPNAKSVMGPPTITHNLLYWSPHMGAGAFGSP